MDGRDLDTAYESALLDQLCKVRSVLRLARWIRLKVSLGCLHRAHRNPLTDELFVGGKSNLPDFGAEISERALGFQQRSHDLRVHAILCVSAVHADPEAAYAIPNPDQIIRNRSPQSRWVVWVRARDDAQHRRGIRRASAHRPDMVERVRQREHA